MSVGFRRVHLLVLVGDGTRVVRLELSRRLVCAVAVVAVLAMGSMIALALHGLPLRRAVQPQAAVPATPNTAPPTATPPPVAAAPPPAPVDNSGARLEAIRGQLATMRAEIASWGALHTGIWRPLGPEGGSSRAAAGVGGAIPALAGPAPTSIEAQLTQILESLTEERQRLQALAKFMAGPGALLRALPSHWPLRGAVNSEFGRRLSPWSGGTEFHGGIDISARLGTVVKAPAPGQVSFAGQSPGYGTTLILDHGREIKTLFGHLREISVNAGDRVERGQAIARSGQTGHATGPHLHYEILVQGRPVNPRGFLWE